MVAVKDVMTRRLVTIGLSQTALDAAKRMSKKRIGGLIVVDDDGKPTGIITESDLVRKVLSESIDPSSVKVSSLLTRTLVSTAPEASLKHAIRIMVENKVRRLPVLENGELVGILTVTDIAKHAAGYPRGTDMAGIVNYWFNKEEQRQKQYTDI